MSFTRLYSATALTRERYRSVSATPILFLHCAKTLLDNISNPLVPSGVLTPAVAFGKTGTSFSSLHPRGRSCSCALLERSIRPGRAPQPRWSGTVHGRGFSVANTPSSLSRRRLFSVYIGGQMVLRFHETFKRERITERKNAVSSCSQKVHLRTGKRVCRDGI